MATKQPTNEHWKPIPGYEGIYEVSDHGRVKSLERKVWNGRGMRRQPERILKPGMKPQGYYYVSLRDGKTTAVRYIHELVLTTFTGPRPEPSFYGRHLDDVKTNNHISNLRWGTPSENSYDKVRNGNDFHAKRTHCKHGHEYTPENTKRREDGARICKQCEKINWGKAKRWREHGPINPIPFCKRGHKMKEPNLIKARLPRRACLACARGRAYADHHGMLDDLQRISDRYYEAIIADSK